MSLKTTEYRIVFHTTYKCIIIIMIYNIIYYITMSSKIDQNHFEYAMNSIMKIMKILKSIK